MNRNKIYLQIKPKSTTCSDVNPCPEGLLKTNLKSVSLGSQSLLTSLTICSLSNLYLLAKVKITCNWILYLGLLDDYFAFGYFLYPFELIHSYSSYTEYNQWLASISEHEMSVNVNNATTILK